MLLGPNAREEPKQEFAAHSTILPPLSSEKTAGSGADRAGRREKWHKEWT